MKSKLILTLLILFSLTANAQLVHVDGSKTGGIVGGVTKNGFNVAARLTLYKASNISYRGSLEYERVNFDLSKANVVEGNPEFVYTFYYYGENLYFSAKAGLLAGVEFLKNAPLNRGKNQFFIGQNLGVGAEYYLSAKIMLNLDIDQRFYQMSKLGKTSFIVKIGVNYNF